MPPRKRAAIEKKSREGSVKSPRARRGPSKSAENLQAWSSVQSGGRNAGANVEHYAETVNMPVGILVGFLVPTALCADGRVMTKDQRLMLLCLFLATMISAFFTFIFSASFIQATASGPSSSAFSTTVGSQRHSRFLHLFVYLSFMLVVFLTCVQNPMLRRRALYPKLVFSLAFAGMLFVFFPPTARVYNDWISSKSPALKLLQLLAIAIVLFGLSSSLKKSSIREIRIALTHSYRTLEKSFTKFKTPRMKTFFRKR